jgi:hypothetical protein
VNNSRREETPPISIRPDEVPYPGEKSTVGLRRSGRGVRHGDHEIRTVDQYDLLIDDVPYSFTSPAEVPEWARRLFESIDIDAEVESSIVMESRSTTINGVTRKEIVITENGRPYVFQSEEDVPPRFQHLLR